ncbi:MAG: hypothetical protein ACLP1X_06930 [Polyangiaceae bacterium]
MATEIPPTVPVPDEDELDELPPLDGDPGDSGEAAPGDDADEIPGPAASDGDLDDATGEDDPADVSEMDLAEGEGAWVGEAQDAADLDLGEDDTLEIRDEGTSFVEAEEPGITGSDFGLDDVSEVAGLDSGEEGPLDADEELRDEDLPSLDADDEGGEIDPGLGDDHFAVDRPLGLSWAAQPLARVGAPVALASASAVACVARGALIAGRTEAGSLQLLRVDLEGESRAAPGRGLHGAEVTALAVEEETVAAVLGDGRLLVSRDAGATFQPHAEGLVATDAVLASGALWVRTSARGLAVSVAAGPFQLRSVEGAVTALSGDGEAGMIALTVDGAGLPLAFLRGRPDGSIESQAAGATEPCGPELVAARGLFVAYPGRRGVVRRGPDGAWRAHAWEGVVTALAFVDGNGSLLAATYSDADDTTALVHLGESGKAAVVARVGPARPDGELDGRALSMACDSARGVIWVAGGFGVAAFAIR